MTLWTVLVFTLMFLGLAMLIVEIVVLPGVGVFAVLGGSSVIAACVMAHLMLPFGQAVAAIAGGLGAAAIILWALPKTRVAKSMVLEAQHLGSAADETLKELVGREGIAKTPLHPAGVAEIDSKRVDVVTEGEYVAAGTQVRVAAVEGNRIVVAPIV